MFSSEIISSFCYLLGGKLAENVQLMKCRFNSLFLLLKKKKTPHHNKTQKSRSFRSKWSSFLFPQLPLCCYFRNLAFNKCPHGPTLLSAGDSSEVI